MRLQARPEAGLGQVQKICLQPPEDFDVSRGTKASDLAQAHAFAQWLTDQSIDDFGISDWSQAVILCPRNEWLSIMAKALEAHAVPVQVHSRKDILGDNPAYCWLTALMHILVYPDDAFEITGVLRELFGISDDAIAAYLQEHELQSGMQHPLNIVATMVGVGPVAAALEQLRQVRVKILNKPFIKPVQYRICMK